MDNSEEKTDTKGWLRSLGCDISDAEMKRVVLKIDKNPAMKYYFTILKRHVKPKEEATKIHKYYLYHTIKNGGFGIEIPPNCTVTSHQDLELTRSYLKSTYKKLAFETIKIPLAIAEMESAYKILSLKKDRVRLLTDNLLNNPVHKVNSLKDQLLSLNKEIRQKHTSIRAIFNPEEGSEEFQRFIIDNERRKNIFQMIEGLSFDTIDANNLSVETQDKLFVTNKLEKLIEYSPRCYITTIKLSLLNPPVNIAENSILTREKLMAYLKQYKYLFTLVDSLKSSSSKLIADLEEHSLKRVDALSKINKIEDDVRTTLQLELVQNVEKVKEKKIVLTREQYSTIEEILNKWEVSLKSPRDCINCFRRKHDEYEIYQLINKYVSGMPVESITFNTDRDDQRKMIIDKNQALSECFDKIQRLIKTNDNVSGEIVKMLNQMPFFELNGEPITDIIRNIKQAIVDLELALTFPI